jgi:hypothetical protein
MAGSDGMGVTAASASGLRPRPSCFAGGTCETAGNHGPDNRLARRERWGLSGGLIGAPQPLLFRLLSAASCARRGPGQLESGSRFVQIPSPNGVEVTSLSN